MEMQASMCSKLLSGNSDVRPPLYTDLKDVYFPLTTHPTPVLSTTSPLGTASLVLSGSRLGLPNPFTMRQPAREIFLEQKPSHATLLLKISP